MIQDINPHQLHNEYELYSPAPDDPVCCFRGGDLLSDPQGHLPRWKQIPQGVEYRYLFSLDGVPWFLALPQQPLTLNGFDYRPARDVRHQKPMEHALAVFTAIHLNGWYRTNRLCGCCGGKMYPGTTERSLICSQCGHTVYPRINPAVIVAVVDGNRLLMTKYNSRVHKVFHYVLIAGFVEIGETAEQAVAREVREEVGLEVTNIRYFASQPWGCDGNLTLGYFAQLDGTKSITIDPDELSDARWFERSEVPVPDDHASVTAELIRQFAQGHEMQWLGSGTQSGR